MGFKADDAVPKLEWDFKPWVDASGVSPEPSSIAQFTFIQNYNNTLEGARRKAMALAAVDAEKHKEMPTEALRAELETWSKYSWAEAIEESGRLLDGILGKDATEELNQRVANLIGEVTENCPSAEQVMSLPGRVRSAYIGWLVGQLSDPEFLTAVTR